MVAWREWGWGVRKKGGRGRRSAGLGDRATHNVPALPRIQPPRRWLHAPRGGARARGAGAGAGCGRGSLPRPLRFFALSHLPVKQVVPRRPGRAAGGRVLLQVLQLLWAREGGGEGGASFSVGEGGKKNGARRTAGRGRSAARQAGCTLPRHVPLAVRGVCGLGQGRAAGVGGREGGGAAKRERGEPGRQWGRCLRCPLRAPPGPATRRAHLGDAFGRHRSNRE